MDFSEALRALKQGVRVQRQAWLSDSNEIALELDREANPQLIELIYPVGSQSFPEGKTIYWHPQQEDLLATDWLALGGTY